MKKIGIFALLLALLLCGCGPRNYAGNLTGTWQGDGTMDLAPLMGARVLTFDKDGMLTVDFGSSEAQYKVFATDDTLTLTPPSGQGAFGVPYEINGNTLIISRRAEFEWVG